jgi:hypothetical protein
MVSLSQIFWFSETQLGESSACANCSEQFAMGANGLALAQTCVFQHLNSLLGSTTAHQLAVDHK